MSKDAWGVVIQRLDLFDTCASKIKLNMMVREPMLSWAGETPLIAALTSTKNLTLSEMGMPRGSWGRDFTPFPEPRVGELYSCAKSIVL